MLVITDQNSKTRLLPQTVKNYKLNRKNPDEAIIHITNTFQWCRTHRLKAGFFNKELSWDVILRSERSRWTLEDYNDLHRVLWLLCVMKMHEHVEGIAIKWEQICEKNISSIAKIRLFLDILYNHYDEISAASNKENAPGLKNLKKYINAFAENLSDNASNPDADIKKQIFNFKKLAKNAAKSKLDEYQQPYNIQDLETDFNFHYKRLKARLDAQHHAVKNLLQDLPKPRARVIAQSLAAEDDEKLLLQPPKKFPKLNNFQKNQLVNIVDAITILANMKTHMYAFVKRNNLSSVKDFEDKNGYLEQFAGMVEPFVYYLNPELECIKNLKKKYQVVTEENIKELNDDYLEETYYGWIPWRTNIVTDNKKNRRWWKWVFNNISIAASYFMAFGEGIVPAVQTAAKAAGVVAGGIVILTALSSGAWALIIAVGIGGAIVNYFLSRNYTYQTLKELFLKNDDGIALVYCDKDGNACSVQKRNVIRLTLATTFMGGLAYGVLSYWAMSSVAFPQILALCGIATISSGGMIVLMALAAVIASWTALALFAIFYRGMAKLISKMEVSNLFKNTWFEKEISNPLAHTFGNIFAFIDKHCVVGASHVFKLLFGITIGVIMLLPLALQWLINLTWHVLKTIGEYLYETFYWPLNWEHMSWSEAIIHYVGQVLKLALTVAAWFTIVFVSVAMAGLFNDKAMQLIGNSWAYSKYFVTILFDYLGSFCNVVFFAQGILGVKDVIVANSATLYKSISEKTFIKDLTDPFKEYYSNPTRFSTNAKAAVSQAVILTSAGLNSKGQGEGPAATEADPNKSYLMQPWLFDIVADTNTASNAAFYATCLGSGGPNAISGVAATKPHESVISPITPSRSSVKGREDQYDPAKINTPRHTHRSLARSVSRATLFSPLPQHDELKKDEPLSSHAQRVEDRKQQLREQALEMDYKPQSICKTP